MDFSVFPCRQKKKPAPPPPPAPAPPPPPPPPKAPTLPEFMQQIPRVPGSRNVEMLFRWNLDNGYYGYDPGFGYGRPNQGPYRAIAPPMPRHMAFPGPHQLGGGMHGGAMQPFGQPFGQGMMHPCGQPYGQGMHPFGGGGMHPFDQGMDPFGGGMHPFGQGHMNCGFDPFAPGMHPHHFGHF